MSFIVYLIFNEISINDFIYQIVCDKSTGIDGCLSIRVLKASSTRYTRDTLLQNQVIFIVKTIPILKTVTDIFF